MANKKSTGMLGLVPEEIIGLKKTSIQILGDLWRANRFLSLSQIAERNNIGWKTANENTKKLEARGLVDSKKSIRRKYFKIKKSFRDSIIVLDG